MANKELFVVRKSQDDIKSQVGSYTILDNAKKACKKAGNEYKVFDSNGEIKYPIHIIINESGVDMAAANPAKLWDFFKSKGLNDFGVAGLLGNIYAISGLRSCNLENSYEKVCDMDDIEYTQAVDNGSYTEFVSDKAGYGLLQWNTEKQKRDLLEFCQKKNKSIGDLDTQLEFLVMYLSTNYKQLWRTLKIAKSAREASDALLGSIGRPEERVAAIQKKRALYGERYLDLYGKKDKIIIDNTLKEIEMTEDTQMKYNNSNKPMICIQNQSSCYKGTSTMTVKGIMWHSVNTGSSNLKQYIQPSENANNKVELLKLLGINKEKSDLNHSKKGIGLNAWIGTLMDGTVSSIQALPWNYKPWGCGSGLKGSCNNGWIQIAICEDKLQSKDYFELAYKEACELSAYLCELFNINPKGNVKVKKIYIPTILCQNDAYKLGFASNTVDIEVWLEKFGKTTEDIRNDIAKLLGNSASKITPIIQEEVKEVETFIIRKTWEDSKTQIGVYTDIENAKKACDDAGEGYEIYNKEGIAIYPEEVVVEETAAAAFAIGDQVMLKPNATFSSGKSIPKWVFGMKLYVRDIRSTGSIVVAAKKKGPITGVIDANNLTEYVETPQEKEIITFVPYLVKVAVDGLNVRTGAGTGYRINTQITKNQVYTIIDEKNGWGKLKNGTGWINLQYVKKI